MAKKLFDVFSFAHDEVSGDYAVELRGSFRNYQAALAEAVGLAKDGTVTVTTQIVRNGYPVWDSEDDTAKLHDHRFEVSVLTGREKGKATFRRRWFDTYEAADAERNRLVMEGQLASVIYDDTIWEDVDGRMVKKPGC